MPTDSPRTPAASSGKRVVPMRLYFPDLEPTPSKKPSPPKTPASTTPRPDILVDGKRHKPVFLRTPGSLTKSAGPVFNATGSDEDDTDIQTPAESHEPETPNHSPVFVRTPSSGRPANRFSRDPALRDVEDDIEVLMQRPMRSSSRLAQAPARVKRGAHSPPSPAQVAKRLYTKALLNKGTAPKLIPRLDGIASPDIGTDIPDSNDVELTDDDLGPAEKNKHKSFYGPEMEELEKESEEEIEARMHTRPRAVKQKEKSKQAEELDAERQEEVREHPISVEEVKQLWKEHGGRENVDQGYIMAILECRKLRRTIDEWW
ncbi:hypothetical protein FN846DRAFT_894781 [Sphaerosporella brunnea]|uniref:Uncharacterized protein n=1 Tax=Sphaerosporella brunnea TaxID=1250544 RepID=A0A5J5EI66_9PEZI|nr:hypothetical protein FN846DRAFT_894781 [Sphaerosporella brunnea]